MTREDMIDEAVRRKTSPIERLFLHSLLSRQFFAPMHRELFITIRAEFRRIVAEQGPPCPA